MPSEGFDEVREWILQRSGRYSIGADENLIENRIVDSLSFVELVYLIEAATGIEVDVEQAYVKDFQTLSAIEQAFFANTPAPTGGKVD
jgi:acyl carrier protein